MSELLLIAVAYMLPTIVAFGLGHRNVVAVGALNLLAGWTGVGWLAAFVWGLCR